LVELGVLFPANGGKITRLPFNGTLSPDERRMLEQGAFRGDFKPVYSTRATESNAKAPGADGGRSRKVGAMAKGR
jgi:hypothetical protein